jgi:site-specific recombinase XerD
MQNIIPQTETTSNQLQELEPHLQDFHAILRLRLVEWTAKHEIQAIRSFITHLILARKHYASLHKQDIEIYLALQRNKPHTVQHTLFTIKRFYDYLLNKGVVAYNPAQDVIMRIRRPRPLMLVPPVHEIRAILKKLEKDESPAGVQYRLMVELAYGSGLRAGEIAILNVNDVDIANQTAHVLGKGNKERVVPLTNRCLHVLEKHMQSIQPPRQAIFVQVMGQNKGQRLRSASVSQAIRHKTGHNAHLYRHACATHMLLNGCNVRYIQELLGHERLETTTIYTNLDKEDLRLIVNEKHPGRLRSTMPTNPEEDI